MNKLPVLFFILFAGIQLSSAQLVFQKTYGGAAAEEILSIKPATDGGFIISGTTYSFGQGGTDARDMFLQKINAVGNITWTRTLGVVNLREISRSVIQTIDGGYISSGIHTPISGGWDEGMMHKYDGTGNLTSSTFYGSTFDDEITKSVEVAGGSFIAHTGLTENWGANAPNLQLMITNPAGVVTASRVVVGSGLDDGLDIRPTTPDNGIIVAGRTNSIGAGGFDFLLVKFSVITTVSWYNAIGGPGDDVATSVRQTADGGFIMAGYTTSYGAGAEDILVVKTTNTGAISWARVIGGASNDRALSIRQTANGGYVIGGYTESAGQPGRNGLIVRLSSTGTVQWSRTYGGIATDQFNELEIRNANAGFVAAGNSSSFGAGNLDAYVVATDTSGFCGCNELAVTLSSAVVAPTSVTTGLTNTTGSAVVNYPLIGGAAAPSLSCQCTGAKPSIEIQGPTLACRNQSGLKYFYTPIPGVTSYTWSANNATINTISGDSAFITVAGANARLFLRTNFGNCSDFYIDTIDITVDLLATTITGDDTICKGDATVLTANPSANVGPVTYLWNTSSILPSINVSPGTTTVYSVTVTDSAGCSANASLPVVVFDYPAVSLGSDSIYCDVPFVLLDAGNPGATYLWSNGLTTQTINATTTGTYWVDVMRNGCTTRDSINLRIGTTPAVSITGDDILCIGDSSVLTANVTGGTVPYTYLWNNALGTNPIVTVGPVINTTYIVEVTEFNGCRNSDTLLVQVFPYPVVDLGPDTLQCGSAGAINLDAGNPGASYLWSTTATSQSIVVNATNIYWVDVTLNTCTTRDSISILYSNNPVVSISGDSAICLGQSTLLSSSVTSGILPYSYNWTSGSTSPTTLVSPSSAITYTLTVTDSAGCIGTATAPVTVTPYPAVNLGNDTLICSAPPFLLNAGNPGFTYLWQDGSANQTFNASVTGIYWVEVTNNNCSSRDSISLSFDTFPVADLGNDFSICEGASAVLDATNPNSTYNWSTGETTASITVNAPGLFWVEVSKCNTSASDTVVLSLDTFQLQSTVTPPYCDASNGTVSIIVNGGFAPYDYAWQSGDTTAVISGIAEGTYNLVVTDNIGCTESISVEVSCSVPDVVIPQLITPNGDGKNDVWIIENLSNFPGNLLSIFNRWGNEVFRAAPYANNWDGRPNVATSIGNNLLPSGTYFYTIDLNGDGSDIRSGYIELMY